MELMFLKFSYYIFEILAIAGLLFLIFFAIKINLKKRSLLRNSIKNLMPEEKFLLKEIFLNTGFLPSFALNNEFLKILEEEGIIYKKSVDKKDIIEYGIKNWIKKEIKKDFDLLSYEQSA